MLLFGIVKINIFHFFFYFTLEKNKCMLYVLLHVLEIKIKTDFIIAVLTKECTDAELDFIL